MTDRAKININRKWHKPFQMTQQSPTLDDLKKLLHFLTCQSCVFWSSPWKFEKR